MNRVAVLFSGRGSNLRALLLASRSRGYRVVGAATNRPRAGGIAIATAGGVPVAVVDHEPFADRSAFESVLDERLREFAPDWLVLAGFMRVLTAGFVARWRGRLVNVHPSLLPAYPGLRTHERVLAAGDREHGASVHFVTGELDGGPVIARIRLAVRPDDTPATLAARLLPLEHRLLPTCVGWLCEGRVHLVGATVTFDGRPLGAPITVAATPDPDAPASNLPAADESHPA